MKLCDVYNFFFHPLSKTHKIPVVALSIATIIALSVLSVGAFAVTFILIQLKDRTVVQQKGQTKESEVFRTTITSTTTPPSPTLSPTLPSTDTDPKLKNLLKQHAKQLELFEEWTLTGNWERFHGAHYDWWMFPIKDSSRQHGEKYALNDAQVTWLKNDAEFMKAYKRGVELMLNSWGWNLTTNSPVENPQPNQEWQGYNIRLQKMAQSLRFVFQDQDLYQVSKEFYNKVCVPYGELDPWLIEVMQDWNW